MHKSLIYRSPLLYRLVMIGLYGREYFSRFRALGAYIEPNSSVVDLCCGFGDFYKYALRDKGVDYTGVDSSEEFAAYGKDSGLDIRLGRVDDFSFSSADYYVMIDSLYHFYDEPRIILEKMLASARKGIMIMEPVKNLADSKYAIISWLAKYMTNEGNARNQHRFSEKTLDELMNSYFKDNLVESKLAEGGRDKMYILKKVEKII